MPRGGKRPGSGRKKGGTNKITSDVKQAILEAFNALVPRPSDWRVCVGCVSNSSLPQRRTIRAVIC